MSIKLKALGLALVAALAMSAVAVVTASAEDDKDPITGKVITGHGVTTGFKKANITGVDHAGKGVQTELHSFGQSIFCETLPEYHATSSTETFIDLTVTPTYKNCKTREPSFTADIDMKGCTYTFTIRHKNPEANHSTVHLVCPAGGPQILVTGTFGNCKIEITPNQTPTKGVLYTQKGTSGTSSHDVTVDVTAENIHSVILEGGFFQCGTSETTTSTGKLTGNVTVKAFEDIAPGVNGPQIPLTVTGGVT